MGWWVLGNVKQVGFEPRLEDSYGRCGSDKIGQTVPDASSGNQKRSVTDGRQSGAARSYHFTTCIYRVGQQSIHHPVANFLQCIYYVPKIMKIGWQ